MKALAIFSGGLDSMLSASLIREQGVEVQALFFRTPFFTPRKARESARHINLPFKVVDITRRHLQVLKRPPHGYGGNMNPCIDCHALMLRVAGEMMEQERADFVISGEVLGQRPMSQNRRALDVVARESGLRGLLLRPLSAKLLPMSVPEAEGWVDRERLMGFRGRSRKPQMALARRMDITRYPSPAGGCLLTEKVFSRRLRDLLEWKEDPEIREIELLKLGRHFRLDMDSKLVVGRNRRENEAIEKLAGPEDILLKTATLPGPTAILCFRGPPAELALAAALTAAYSDAPEGEAVEVTAGGPNESVTLTAVTPDKGSYRGMML